MREGKWGVDISGIMQPATYPNLPDLVIDVIKHIERHGDFMVISNNYIQLTFIWECIKTHKTFTIGLAKVRRGVADDPTTPLGLRIRQIQMQYVDQLNAELWQKDIIRDDLIKRMVKLRAFW